MKFFAFACLGLLANSVLSHINSDFSQGANCDLPGWSHPDNRIVNGDFEKIGLPKGRSWISTNHI